MIDVEHLIENNHHEESGHSTHRIQVFTADFLRVKVPFIIALWIFFASIAKIGLASQK